MPGPKYTTIKGLQKIESDRHLVNLAVERSNASITEWEVVAKLEEAIEDASREFDGFVRGHVGVPFDITETVITGDLTFTQGSTAVSGGGSLDTEVEVGEFISLDADIDIRAKVAEVTDANNIVLEAEYHGAGGTGSASIITDDVPAEVENIVRGYVAFMLWARRGRDYEKNPHKEREKLFMRRIRDIQIGRYRFERDSAEVKRNPVKYDTESERTMTDANMTGFTP